MGFMCGTAANRYKSNGFSMTWNFSTMTYLRVKSKAPSKQQSWMPLIWKIMPLAFFSGTCYQSAIISLFSVRNGPGNIGFLFPICVGFIWKDSIWTVIGIIKPLLYPGYQYILSCTSEYFLIESTHSPEQNSVNNLCGYTHWFPVATLDSSKASLQVWCFTWHAWRMGQNHHCHMQNNVFVQSCEHF